MPYSEVLGNNMDVSPEPIALGLRFVGIDLVCCTVIFRADVEVHPEYVCG